MTMSKYQTKREDERKLRNEIGRDKLRRWCCSLPSERREKKSVKDVLFIPYEYNIKIINRNIKILNGSATMTVHICTVTVAIVHKCTIMHKLVWVFFSSNCVKSATFSILHNYTQADVIALSPKE